MLGIKGIPNTAAVLVFQKTSIIELSNKRQNGWPKAMIKNINMEHRINMNLPDPGERITGDP